MGAVPKKKPSKTRARHRHTAWSNKFSLPHLQKCPNCGELKRLHRVCLACGMYNGMKVIDPKTMVKKVS
ncbi:50S ribosomal protein L32 [candidate division WWE3 bacterium]|uniref:Large ribosomal subunit protein bL32 n=1 Tax=candidate division WWE3 bacterium TaxID=2053526 RepID=A0A955LG75_UNCKA|nr:50S ribosomal protein L32 [candidate division WWE3 bacterium]